MITVLLSWIALTFVFLAFGKMTVGAWDYIIKDKTSYSIFDAFWIGMCSFGTILLFLSIFVPLNIWVLLCTLLLSAGYWIKNWIVLKDLFIRTIKTIQSFSIAEKATLFLIFIAITVYALSTPLIFDEGLYHLQTMQWTEKYRAVAGLGNLHGRFGFNSSFLLLSTVFNYHPSFYEPFFTINSLALLALALWLLAEIIKTENTLIKAILSFILVFSIFTFGANTASTSTDLLPNILVIYLLVSLALNTDQLNNHILKIVLIASFCITLKLSSTVILLLILFPVFTLLKKKKTKTVFAILAIGLLVATPWLIRFVILTGYLIYPFPAIDLFSVDWKIPDEMVIMEKDLAYVWARAAWLDPEVVLSMTFSQWFPLWLGNQSVYHKLLYLAAIVSPLLVFIFFKQISNKRVILLYAIALVGVIFGFATAPDLRFTSGFIICSILLPFVALAERAKTIFPEVFLKLNRSINSFVVIATGLAMILFIDMGTSQIRTYQYLSSKSYSSLIYKPQPISLLEERDKAEFAEYKLGDYMISIPKNAMQCFEQEIPCTPIYSTNLKLRGNRLQDGFRIDDAKD